MNTYMPKHYDRKEEIDTIFELIESKDYYKENSSNGLSILVNGPWGSGKTTFIEDFRKKAETEKKI